MFWVLGPAIGMIVNDDVEDIARLMIDLFLATDGK